MARASSLLRLRDCIHTHYSGYDSSGRVIGPPQRPLPDNTQHSQQTDMHTPSGIRTRNPYKRTAADPCLIPRGHWDQHYSLCADISGTGSLDRHDMLHLNYKRRSLVLCALDSVTASVGPSASAAMPLPGLEHTVRTNKMHPATQSNIPE